MTVRRSNCAGCEDEDLERAAANLGNQSVSSNESASVEDLA